MDKAVAEFNTQGECRGGAGLKGGDEKFLAEITLRFADSNYHCFWAFLANVQFFSTVCDFCCQLQAFCSWSTGLFLKSMAPRTVSLSSNSSRRPRKSQCLSVWSFVARSENWWMDDAVRQMFSCKMIKTDPPPDQIASFGFPWPLIMAQKSRWASHFLDSGNLLQDQAVQRQQLKDEAEHPSTVWSNAKLINEFVWPPAQILMCLVKLTISSLTSSHNAIVAYLLGGFCLQWCGRREESWANLFGKRIPDSIRWYSANLECRLFIPWK